MTPLCIYSRFVDLVGVTVLYRQMAVDSVGVAALYIHGDLLLSVRLRGEASAGFGFGAPVCDSQPSFLCVVTTLCIYTCFVDLVGVSGSAPRSAITSQLYSEPRGA